MTDTLPPRYWHGGAPGLRVGDLITPRAGGDMGHLVDGCPTCEARRTATPDADDDNDPAFVYVTTNREYARIYAAGYPRGDIYRVEPIGELYETTGRRDPVPSWAVPEARVTAVYDRAVNVSWKRLQRLMKQVVK